MSIVNQCMIVNLQIGAWTGHRLDKEASARVTSEAHAHADAARVNKHLVAKEALKPINTAANAVRSHFYNKTLPWKDNGDRVLTRKLYMPFIERHQELVRAFEAEVEQFLEKRYPAAKAQAEFRMGELFRASDYPREDDLRRRFYVHIDVDAIAQANDFRVDMDAEERIAIQKQMEDAMAERINRSMRDVWDRLATTIGHFADRMGSDAVFRDSTVRNLDELVDMLPGLNFMDDPELNRIEQEVRAKLYGIEPKDLRKDPSVREAAASDAQKIMDDMKGFMAAFGNAA